MATAQRTNLSAKSPDSSARIKITEVLMESGVPRGLAEQQAEKATLPIREAHAKAKKLDPKERLKRQLEEAVENAQTEHDSMRIILNFTPKCWKLGNELPVIELYNNNDIWSERLDDFQYCCTALVTPKKKRTHINNHRSPLNDRYACDPSFTKNFIEKIEEHLHQAVIERFIEIYMEVFGPNGFDIQGKEYDKIVKTYGVDPKNLER